MVAIEEGYRPPDDPMNYLRKRKSEIDRTAASDRPPHMMDEKELAERQAAAKAYASEDEKHFVDYGQDCIDQSRKAMEPIRATQAACWAMYNEDEPASYFKKEEWQSRIIVPRPYQTVQYGASAIKKAFSPNFLSVENAQSTDAGDFWQKVMQFYLDPTRANFKLKFTDACVMALAVGLSMELIPRWVPRKGLEFVLVEPWKIHRDPDTISRDPQSGMFWIHQEWIDYFVLQEGEKRGKYFDVARVKNTEESTSPAGEEDPFMTKEAIMARKEQIWEHHGSKFRKMIMVNEFWGQVLDSRGDMLLPNATYTFAGGRVIELPKAVRYARMRWPGISFSPLPSLLSHGGRGLLKGVMSIWEAMCNLMCLHQDNLIWVVNPMTEINTDLLVDPTDVNTWPGKEYLTREGAHGNQAVKNVERKSRTNEVLANAQQYDGYFQRGSFVPDNITGAPGYRQDITFREAAMNLDQSLGVYSLMGENIELGAIQACMAALDIIQAQATLSDYMRPFKPEEFLRYKMKFQMMVDLSPKNPTRLAGVPQFDGSFHISGIQALMRDNETLQNIKTVIIPLAGTPPFAQYIKAHPTLKAIERRVNLTDEGLIATDEEAQIIDQQLAAQAEKEQKGMDQLRQVQEALGVTDVIRAVEELAGGKEKGEAEDKKKPPEKKKGKSND